MEQTLFFRIVFGICCLCVVGLYGATVIAFVLYSVSTGYGILIVALAMTTMMCGLYYSHLRPAWRQERQVAPLPLPAP